MGHTMLILWNNYCLHPRCAHILSIDPVLHTIDLHSNDGNTTCDEACIVKNIRFSLTHIGIMSQFNIISNDPFKLPSSLRRHQMETFSALLALLRGNHRSPGKSPQRSVTWRFDVSLICVWINGWVNNGEAGDLRHHQAHYDVTVMSAQRPTIVQSFWEMNIMLSYIIDKIVLIINCAGVLFVTADVYSTIWLMVAGLFYQGMDDWLITVWLISLSHSSSM